MTTARAQWRFDAIGTRWEVQTAAALPGDARRAASAVIERFDGEWSRFRPDSVVSTLARGGGEVTVIAPADAAAMLDAYGEMSEATAGAVSPLVGGALAHRGYDADYSLVDRGPVAATGDWRERLTWDADTLTLREPALIDVGALGKGRLVDLVAGCLSAWGGGGIVVDAGGDISVCGVTERIGLEHPYDPTRAIGVWEVADAALCASAVNRRAWGDSLHHVLDARTGQPVRTVAATWAVAPTAMRADAAATALFFTGGEALAAGWGVSWVRMATDGRVDWSPGCTAELFTAAR
ncbi:FAD:protein FMN transferase [Microbacterium sp. zg.Y909]|uniref:FAD:protein FMN transferase n=1 Tax=Microbacterium sp. zg.Y909 TaxID=2969413 RepID=UPI00214D0912|nr:FAD:protein FMN transferase [Microbacterium sp. zg.Y909]MCR2825568.1 FAD:protein FMN transferase [Microbacterium sp. zg.Y909]